MSIIADFRKKELKNQQMLFLAIKPGLYHFARTRGEAFPTIESAKAAIKHSPDGYVVKLHKKTIEKLKKMHPYKLGLVLSYYMMNRQNY